MAETQSAPSLRELSEAAPKGPWTVRPQKYDDWGWVRGPLREDGFRPVIFVAKGDDDEAEQSAARAEGRQPRQTEAISAFLCRLENDYRAGRLIDPTTLTEAVAAARAETEREREALKLAMQFLDRCVGEGIGFVKDDTYPEADAMDVACAIAERLGIDVQSDAFASLVAYPAPPTTPGGRTDG